MRILLMSARPWTSAALLGFVVLTIAALVFVPIAADRYTRPLLDETGTRERRQQILDAERLQRRTAMLLGIAAFAALAAVIALGVRLQHQVEATEQGRIALEREMDSKGRLMRDSTRRIAIDVADSGPGIPSDKLELVFEEFTRLDHGGKPGAGLGLAIARRIARLLDGDITVTSEVGRGSCFTLWLSRVRA